MEKTYIPEERFWGRMVKYILAIQNDPQLRNEIGYHIRDTKWYGGSAVGKLKLLTDMHLPARKLEGFKRYIPDEFLIPEERVEKGHLGNWEYLAHTNLTNEMIQELFNIQTLLDYHVRTNGYDIALFEISGFLKSAGIDVLTIGAHKYDALEIQEKINKHLPLNKEGFNSNE